MKKLILLLTMVSLPSFASVSANVSFASDYIWRGMTQSDGPAVQGGFDYASDGGFYAGLWGSNVNFNDGAGSELDYYAGYGFSLGDVGVDDRYANFSLWVALVLLGFCGWSIFCGNDRGIIEIYSGRFARQGDGYSIARHLRASTRIAAGRLAGRNI